MCFVNVCFYYILLLFLSMKRLREFVLFVKFLGNITAATSPLMYIHLLMWMYMLIIQIVNYMACEDGAVFEVRSLLSRKENQNSDVTRLTNSESRQLLRNWSIFDDTQVFDRWYHVKKLNIEHVTSIVKLLDDNNCSYNGDSRRKRRNKKLLENRM